MDEITLKNFRCFRDEQNVRLAPLTLLVGENSTGKTSFMAMMRALWDVAFGYQIPNFKEEPYDLGSFDDIAHNRGSRGGRAEFFGAEFCTKIGKRKMARSIYRFSVTFGRNGTEPIVARRHLEKGKVWLEANRVDRTRHEYNVGTTKGQWRLPLDQIIRFQDIYKGSMIPMYDEIFSFYIRANTSVEEGGNVQCIPARNSPEIGKGDIEEIAELMNFRRSSRHTRPYASAPVRSRPQRTYDPAPTLFNPEGNYVPMFLANTFFQSRSEWEILKNALEKFGRASGLFDEISIIQLGKKESQPFQVHIRKSGGRLKGSPRNLIDVGYGVSQILPLLTELLRQDGPNTCLIQQPEIHLHPKAQAALGTLLCKIAGQNGRQLIIETHSDHLLDRVRMDVRDRESDLKPDDVSILFFERVGLDVNIHSLRLDERGNVLDAPDSYRRFFMEEVERSLGIV